MSSMYTIKSFNCPHHPRNPCLKPYFPLLPISICINTYTTYVLLPIIFNINLRPILHTVVIKTFLFIKFEFTVYVCNSYYKNYWVCGLVMQSFIQYDILLLSLKCALSKTKCIPCIDIFCSFMSC
jgi:hypothetical protein